MLKKYVHKSFDGFEKCGCADFSNSDTFANVTRFFLVNQFSHELINKHRHPFSLFQEINWLNDAYFENKFKKLFQFRIHMNERQTKKTEIYIYTEID